MYSVITKLIHLTLDAIFPKTCFGCANTGNYFCDECIFYTPRQIHQRCIVCQKPSLLGLTHPKCKTKFTPDKLSTCFDYNTFPIKQLIIAGKYQFVKEIFNIFGQLIAQEITTTNELSVCEIPLSTKRRRWRGFNQTQIIAEQFADLNNLHYHSLLVRPKHTKVQKDLSKLARVSNLKQAFAIKPEVNLPEKIILIDDVTTTGTTFLEAASILKRAGVKYVWCIAIAQD